jgi:hypothetical protein
MTEVPLAVDSLSQVGKRYGLRRMIPFLDPPSAPSDQGRGPKKEWIPEGEFGIRLRRPRNDFLGACVGERRTRLPAASGAHHTKHCYVTLLIHHTVDEPPLIANVGGHSHEEEVGRNLMRPMQYA